MTSPAAYREANREKLRTYARAYHSTPEAKARKRRLVDANREKINRLCLAAKWRRRGVNISRPCPDACECCGKLFTTERIGNKSRGLFPCCDHCHLTDRFRGWICNKCNTALGLVGDTVVGARNLVNYLETR